ncbi:MAG: NYN domain-containing protein [Gemmatimonadetes bacterium]|nr:NYN domain-containing protein [Gemmatimonadota bacterium]
MIYNYSRGSHQSGPSPANAPNAALLIDFDNVTMAIRSDLGKELKALMNSDIIRGKVSVQRAYADWRRYPQYIVPLAESSIDLIFAPAYGSAKKNATDLRMAIDAMELVFTRPEIGTFILLTGDSDFSSCVLKLKEYGKYVIGVGMRESSSDLLIQNCDEYYSYHAISGLTRAGADEGIREDPWDLVERAARQMVIEGDVMRTDRLKQVMLGLDPGFDEKKLGYTKFSRFVSEAEKKGLVRLRKMEDGQYEITGTAAEGATDTAASAPESRSRDRDVRRGRGDRGRRRGSAGSEPRTPVSLPAPQPITVTAPAPTPEPALEPTLEPTLEPRVADTSADMPAATPASEAPAALKYAQALLQHAIRALATRNGDAVRDGDVKRKMLEMDASFDEAPLGFSKFSRFLRHAHEAEIVDLNRVDGGQYEVSLGARKMPPPALSPQPAPVEEPVREATVAAAQPSGAESALAEPSRTEPSRVEAVGSEPATKERPAAPLRGRRGGRGRSAEGPPPILPGQVVQPSKVIETPESVAEPAIPAVAEEDVPAPEAAVISTGAADQPAREDTAAEAPKRRSRRGGRSRKIGEASLELLPGQVVEAPAEAAAEPEATAPEAAEEAAGEDTSRKRRRGGRGRKRKDESPAAVPDAAAPDVAAPDAAEPEVAAASFSVEALGLPRDPDAITAYLTNSYKGVGKKTVESMIDAFGEDMFRVFAEEPNRLREVLGDRRAAIVLEQWVADFARRSDTSASAEEASGEESSPAATETAPAEDEDAADRKPRARSRGRGGRKKKDQPTPA